MIFSFYGLLDGGFSEVEKIALVFGVVMTKFEKTCIHTLGKMIF
jgi:hypothetical protein